MHLNMYKTPKFIQLQIHRRVHPPEHKHEKTRVTIYIKTHGERACILVFDTTKHQCKSGILEDE